MIQRACTVCGRLSDEGRCERHRWTDRRPTAAQRGYDARWRATRRAFLRANPLCAGCGGIAVHVHHLDGQGPLGPRGHDFGNLQGLCASCHSKITARMQPGGWSA